MADSNVEALGEKLIPIINKLQEILRGANLSDDSQIDLPEIAVVGSQSSGKSSVLESLVGRDFLPRGPNICTRRPLVLHLRRLPAAPEGEPVPEEWAEFHAHLPGRRFTDFDAVRVEIEAETNRLLGKDSKAVSANPIYLTVHSPHVLTMSLIDLPGMTRVPVRGQATDIADTLRELICSYINSPSCIILAVSAANTDLANSDAIMLAQSVDPDGRRTIGVLTKLDIMDRGTDGVAMLKGNVVPLRLGYVGIVNRTQADVNASTPITQAHQNEQAFFDSRPEYKAMKKQCGIPVLRQRMQSILVDHIKSRMPELKHEISSRESTTRAELDSLGQNQLEDSSAARSEMLLRLLTEYNHNFGDMLHGRSAHIAGQAQLIGGARIRHVFQQIFAPAIDHLDACCGLTDEQVWTTMSNCAGVNKELLVSKDAFEDLVQRSIRQLRKPMQHCLLLVSHELYRIADLCAPPEVARFPYLQSSLEQMVRDFITESSVPAERMLNDLHDCEAAYINCDHPEFIGARSAIRAAMDERLSQVENSRQQAEERPNSRNHTNPPRNANARHHVGLLEQDAQSASGNSLSDGGDAAGHSEEEQHGWFSFFGRKGDQDGGAAAVPPSRAGEIEREAPVGFAAVLGPSKMSMALSVVSSEGPNLPSAPNQLCSRITSERERDDVRVMRRMIDSYFCIVRRNMKDLVPKTIMKFMVVNARTRLHPYLIQHLFKDDLCKQLMRERDDIVSKRRKCTADLAILQAALIQLQQLPKELAAHTRTADGDAPAADSLLYSQAITMTTPRGRFASRGNNASSDRAAQVAKHAAGIANGLLHSESSIMMSDTPTALTMGLDLYE